MKKKVLVLENLAGQTLRRIDWVGNTAMVYRDLDTGRIGVSEDENILEERGIRFETLELIERESLEGEILRINDVQLRLVSLVEKIAPLSQLAEENPKDFKTISKRTAYGHLALFCLMLGTAVWMSYTTRETQPTVVTIMQKPQSLPMERPKTIRASAQKISPRITQARVANKIKVSRTTFKSSQPKAKIRTQVSPTPIESMGALGALGGLSTGKKGSAGFQLNARNSSLGTDLKRADSGGRGGFEKAVHGQGLISGPIGTGGATGAGGYSTRGQGGGRPGYGQMKIAGGSGFSLPLEEEALIEGGLDRDQIAAVIQRNLGQIIYCYEKGLQVEPSLSGRVAVEFVIAPSGVVSRAKIDNTSLNDRPVEGCIVGKLRGWKFPRPYGNVNVKVTYPFLLKRVG